MNKKLKLEILVVVFAVTLYFGVKLLFGIFTPYNYWTAKQDIADRNVQIIVVGEPDFSPAKQEMAKSYGFYYRFIGCNVTTALMNGTQYYNRQVERYLIIKYGLNFFSKFNKQVDRAISSQIKKDSTGDQVTDVVASLKIVKAKIKIIDSLSHNKRHISLSASLNDTLKNIYLVEVSEDNGVSFVTYFRFFVNGQTLKVINPNGKL